MPDEVTLDVTTIEENVTVETTAGDVVEIQVVAPTGPTGATGPAGPNSVTSATTSDGTANLSLSNVSTATATVSSLLTAGHIHGNLAGTLYTHVRTGEAMSKGDPFYISGFHVGSSQPIAMRADAANASKMPAVGVMDADYAINTSSANGIISGTLSSVDTDGYAVNSPIYVANGGGYSNTAGTIPQQIGITERANVSTGAFIVTNSKVISFADVSDAQTGTAQLSLGDLEVVGGEIYTDGDYSQIYTQGTDAHIFTLGSGAEIYTVGEVATIATQGANATISTAGANAGISTAGANATIYTQGTNATISTAGSAAHIQTNHASAAVKSTNFAAVESGGASLVDGSMQPCLTWSAGGRNLTIPSGTAVTFDSTSYTYGTGAAAAHRTALGLTTLATTTPGTNVANFLEFPTSDNLASALTDENGTGGGFVRAEGATLTSPALVGPVNLTSQDSSTADRVMNRSLSDTRVIKNRVEGKARVFTPLASPTSLGGSVNQTIGSNIVSLLISAANTHSGYLFSDLSPHSAWSGLGFNFARNFLCSGVFYLRNIGDQNSSLRFFIGTPASYRSDQASLSTAGLCLEIRRGGSALQARLAYFSNTYQETAWVNVHNSTIYYQSVYSFVIRNSGNGNVDVYFRVSTETVSTNTKPLPDIDGTPIISITNGPTTVGGTALAVALCAATSTTPSAQTEARVQNLDLELLS